MDLGPTLGLGLAKKVAMKENPLRVCYSGMRLIFNLQSVTKTFKCYLVVHDGSQTHDTYVHIIFLTDESGVL